MVETRLWCGVEKMSVAHTRKKKNVEIREEGKTWKKNCRKRRKRGGKELWKKGKKNWKKKEPIKEAQN